jgi:hypothetical protein
MGASTSGQVKPDTNKYVISGKIYDSSTRETINAVTIMVEKKFACLSDAAGDFELKLPLTYSKRNFEIFIGCVGYKPVYVAIKNNDSTFKKALTVYLKEQKIDSTIKVAY